MWSSKWVATACDFQFLQNGFPSPKKYWNSGKDRVLSLNVLQEENPSRRLPLKRNMVGTVTCWFRLLGSESKAHLLHWILGYEWKKLISSQGRYTMQVSKSEAGSYRCRAENGVEPSLESDFQLQVSGTELANTFFWGSFYPPRTVLSYYSKWGALALHSLTRTLAVSELWTSCLLSKMQTVRWILLLTSLGFSLCCE